MNNNIKRIPYGLTDFHRIQVENYYYVDKTKYIPALEQAGNFLFLIRPRRFGKSLFLAILDAYYDIAKKDEFDTYFANTAIALETTAEKNSYLVLNLNFSAVNPDISKVEESFEMHCKTQFDFFNRKYARFFDDSYFEEYKKRTCSYDRLEYIASHIKEKELKFYVIIDEYDNFANTILTTRDGEEKYKKLTHDDGFFRFFFNKLKAATSGNNAAISRLFITGVSPVTMNDVTSGFNIGLNITTNPVFGELLGFTEDEIQQMINYYKTNGKMQQDTELMPFFRKWYGGYHFTKQKGQKLFNTDCILYFINYLTTTGYELEDPIDPNLKTDYSKLQHLIIVDRKPNGNFSRLKEIVEKGSITSEIKTSFALHELVQTENFVTLLYYLGLITIKDSSRGEAVLNIPNETIKNFLSLYIRNSYNASNIFSIEIYHFSNLMRRMAYDGEWQNVFTFLSDEIKKQKGTLN